ncbi:MAG: class I SAM-dependent methyltransferase [Ignavibacteriota bacterium]|nr:MAG: class I SAM-dependent methyltransferase [Chlorobiota bacterium]MBE7475360.1 class I SAM-dependent methyltransferase [Ignavibacteriales bacterium]MBL1122326.1 class I SAM-dependent methyltransferase [Ignavibacteriota bacterium]MCC7094364.1 class I SAM-dependent methyltransferase [Ignavibacteriaceae bacterium]MCE7854960.1 class I SAM-dependent methyltransferase [Ignavibacteria bacterium CHB3]MEB2295133.1 class I SAM-dependent methyltransferase [Ignavibacteria bacterium]
MKPLKKKSLIKSLAFRVLYPATEKYLSKERKFKYKGINVIVFPGVFHPGFFFSTKILLNYLAKLDLHEKYLLELGAGTGLLSIFASKHGAFVTASDLSLTAVYNIEKNVKLTDANVEVVHSDLFDDIPHRRYDYIVINPPYYKKNPASEKELAWFGGDDFQYFRKLFSHLGNNFYDDTTALMVISDEAEIEMIKSIAREYNFLMKEVFHKKTWGENHFIFSIISLQSQ